MDNKDKKVDFSFDRAFSNEKGAFGSFLLFFLPGFFGVICLNDAIHRRFSWRSVLDFLIISAACSILYFIAKFLAYRTNIFPKIKKRERFHAIAFFLLILLTCAAFFVITVLIH